MDTGVRFDEKTVQMFDNASRAEEFNYTKVYADQYDFAKTSYNTSIAPLVKRTIGGDSTAVLFGGIQALKINHFLLSQTVMQGLLHQAAGQLLHSVNSGDKKNGSVTFSWYKIDCTPSESIVDVLKAASSTQNLTGNEVPEKAGSQLVLRELGKGRGMSVPGLWEVEIASGADIEAVISHVQKIVPSVDHSMGTFHTVMQLTVVNKGVQDSQVRNSADSVSSRISTNPGDQPGTGRLTFVLLSNIAPIVSTAGKLSYPISPHYPWVEQTYLIVQWLESKRASPPFHKSRILLLLRDVLCRKQSASIVLMLQPNLEQHAINREWLQLVSRIARDNPSSEIIPGPPLTRKDGPVNSSATETNNILAAAKNTNPPKQGIVRSTSARKVRPTQATTLSTSLRSLDDQSIPTNVSFTPAQRPPLSRGILWLEYEFILFLRYLLL